jgi:hypothetical protein
MPDQTVQVTFDPNANPQFTFSPSSVTMTAAGKVILQSPGSQSWLFVSPGATVKNDTLNQFSASVQGGGQSVQIDDAMRNPRGTRTVYNYNATVSLNGTTYTSPDPDIVNEPS